MGVQAWVCRAHVLPTIARHCPNPVWPEPATMDAMHHLDLVNWKEDQRCRNPYVQYPAWRVGSVGTAVDFVPQLMKIQLFAAESHGVTAFVDKLKGHGFFCTSLVPWLDRSAFASVYGRLQRVPTG